MDASQYWRIQFMLGENMFGAPTKLLTTKELTVLAGVAGAIMFGAGTIWYYGGTQGAQPAAKTVPVAEARSVSPEVQERTTQPEAAPVVMPAPPAENAALLPKPTSVTIDVRGAVALPNIYTFKADSRVRDAIDEAGGLLPEADASGLNMLAQLIDGTTLTIPERARAEVREGRLIGRRGNTAYVVNPPQYLLSAAQFPPAAAAESPAAVAVSTAAAAAPAGLLNLNTATKEQLEGLPGIGPVTADKILQHRTAQPFTSVDDLQQVHGIGEKKLEAVRPFITAP